MNFYPDPWIVVTMMQMRQPKYVVQVFLQCIYMPYVPVFMHKLVTWPHPLLDNCSHFKNNGKLHQYVFVFLKY